MDCTREGKLRWMSGVDLTLCCVMHGASSARVSCASLYSGL